MHSWAGLELIKSAVMSSCFKLSPFSCHLMMIAAFAPFCVSKESRAKVPFSLQDLTMTLSNNTNTIILRAPLSAAKQMPQSSVMENCTEGFFRKNWTWSSNKLNMARHMLFSPFALRLRYDNPNNLFQVQEGGRSFGGSRETERAFGQIKVRNSDEFWWSFHPWSEQLRTKSCHSGPCQVFGWPHGGTHPLRLPHGNERRQEFFHSSLESVIHLMHLSHLSHLHIIQESSPVLDCEFRKDLTGATSFKDLFTQKWQASICLVP